MKTETAIKTKVYYDPAVHEFRTIRGVAHNGYIVSHPCEFYDDAKTTIAEEIISDSDFENLIAVDKIETFPYAEKINLGSEGFNFWAYKATKNPSLEKMSSLQLESLLSISVEEENYEEASKIRDQIQKRRNFNEAKR